VTFVCLFARLPLSFCLHSFRVVSLLSLAFALSFALNCAAQVREAALDHSGRLCAAAEDGGRV
jgi:hypothetical protein